MKMIRSCETWKSKIARLKNSSFKLTLRTKPVRLKNKNLIRNVVSKAKSIRTVTKLSVRRLSKDTHWFTDWIQSRSTFQTFSPMLGVIAVRVGTLRQALYRLDRLMQWVRSMPCHLDKMDRDPRPRGSPLLVNSV